MPFEVGWIASHAISSLITMNSFMDVIKIFGLHGVVRTVCKDGLKFPERHKTDEKIDAANASMEDTLGV
jgi:hypothetical protein